MAQAQACQLRTLHLFAQAVPSMCKQGYKMLTPRPTTRMHAHTHTHTSAHGHACTYLLSRDRACADCAICAALIPCSASNTASTSSPLIDSTDTTLPAWGCSLTCSPCCHPGCPSASPCACRGGWLLGFPSSSTWPSPVLVAPSESAASATAASLIVPAPAAPGLTTSWTWPPWLLGSTGPDSGLMDAALWCDAATRAKVCRGGGVTPWGPSAPAVVA
eukprot:1158447-Pelagomonas_calceolata.AAC.9